MGFLDPTLTEAVDAGLKSLYHVDPDGDPASVGYLVGTVADNIKTGLADVALNNEAIAKEIRDGAKAIADAIVYLADTIAERREQH